MHPPMLVLDIFKNAEIELSIKKAGVKFFNVGSKLEQISSNNFNQFRLDLAFIAVSDYG